MGEYDYDPEEEVEVKELRKYTFNHLKVAFISGFISGVFFILGIGLIIAYNT
jgi:ABC-type transport system involved in cytochrome bd biosynthesis fused ATPase/permease subunit